MVRNFSDVNAMAEETFGPYSVTVENDEGNLQIDTTNLQPAIANDPNSPRALPDGDYALSYKSTDGEFMGEVNTSISVGSPGTVSSGSSGGCNTMSGLVLLVLPLVALTIRRRRGL